MSIDKLILLHQSLVEECTPNGLDEAASIPELAESVLYYSVEGAKLSETVQFAGLCTALYELPSALNMEEPTQVVQLAHGASLVFQQVEPRVLGVAQISGPCTPIAVAAALKKCHSLFCLLRGGGIQRRLQDKKGMELLFELRKKLRKLEALRGIEVKDWKATERAIVQLLPTLPISALRRELLVHYDAFLGDRETSFCNLTDLVPPVCKNAGRAPPYLATRLLMNVRDAMNDGLLGASMFYNGCFVWTHHDSAPIDNGAVFLLYEYMTGFRQESTAHVTATPQRPAPRRFLGLSLAMDTPPSPAQVREPTNGFMEPPSLSMLSALDEENGLEYDGDTRLWAPRVSLGDLDCRVCMYTNGAMDFLIFFRGDDAGPMLQGFVEKTEMAEPGNDGDATEPVTFPSTVALFVDRRRNVTTIRCHSSSVPQSRNSSPQSMSFDSNNPLLQDSELVASLSTEALRAMDGAMTEAQRRREQNAGNGVHESVTTVSKGWVVVHQAADLELYALLESKEYATLDDVGKQKTRLLGHFLNGH